MSEGKPLTRFVLALSLPLAPAGVKVRPARATQPAFSMVMPFNSMSTSSGNCAAEATKASTPAKLIVSHHKLNFVSLGSSSKLLAMASVAKPRSLPCKESSTSSGVWSSAAANASAPERLKPLALPFMWKRSSLVALATIDAKAFAPWSSIVLKDKSRPLKLCALRCARAMATSRTPSSPMPLLCSDNSLSCEPPRSKAAAMPFAPASPIPLPSMCNTSIVSVLPISTAPRASIPKASSLACSAVFFCLRPRSLDNSKTRSFEERLASNALRMAPAASPVMLFLFRERASKLPLLARWSAMARAPLSPISLSPRLSAEKCVEFASALAMASAPLLVNPVEDMLSPRMSDTAGSALARPLAPASPTLLPSRPSHVTLDFGSASAMASTPLEPTLL
mmetsp:Transcript_76872/g.213553  ORF Transcript_76872/g.213553 Transcript_76872/m.213553 type:complete len:394 (-) Transcript_76872:316-1497(-)